MTKARTLADNYAADISGITAGTGITGGGTSGTVTITNEMATTITAKGDLLAGTGNAAFDNLAAGNSGETLVADSSTSTGLRYNPQNALANPFINGGFDIWQRGTSISYAASTAGTTYHADRWQGGSGANQATTISRQSVGDTTNLPNIQYCLRWQRNSGQTGTGGYAPSHSIETANSLPFAGKTVTYSFYARKGANYSAASDALSVYFVYGTGTDQSVQGGLTGQTALVNGTAATLTTTWQRFAYTFTIPATATQLAAYWIFTPVGTAGAADYFEVTGVQLDVGTYTASSAPTFRRAGGNIAGELAACQRYYFRITAGNAYGRISNVWPANSTTTVYPQMNHPVTMRVAPTAVDYANIAIADGVNVVVPTSFLLSAANNNVTAIQCDATGLTQYRPYGIFGNNNTAGYLGLSAEL